MASAWPSMMRKNWRASASSRGNEEPNTAAEEPLIATKGVSSSRLTMVKNSARNRSNSTRGVRSCMVTTIEANAPSSEWIGVALISVRTDRPSGTRMTISSARTVSPLLNARAKGNSLNGYSRPSARRTVMTPRSRSGGIPGPPKSSMIRAASWLKDTRTPV